MTNSPIQIDGRWYVLATGAPVQEQPYALKRDALFACFDRQGDIVPWEGTDLGLYAEDTRYLSSLELRLDGARPLHLNTTVRDDGSVLAVELMNPDLQRGDRIAVPKGSVHLLRRKLLLDGACHEQVRLANHGMEPVELTLELRFDADFADLFEVRGTPRRQRGQRLEPRVDDGALVFGYDGVDGRPHATRVRFDGAPSDLEPGLARYRLRLAPAAHVTLQWQIDLLRPGMAVPAALAYDDARRRHEERLEARVGGCRLTSSNPMLDRWLQCSASDLDMLTTALPTGPYPFAGVPWYCTTFGRDGLITAHQCLWLRPELARGVLAFLASTQATARDAATDAEPGKILHEARMSEMALTREVPFARYYGSVDATLLFVVLAAAYWRRSADLAFARALWPHVMAAMQWAAQHGDRDGDGFVEYARQSGDGLIQQGWKDSHDSVFHADGRAAPAPIALCEVQGYAYAARLGAAELAEALDEPQAAANWRAEAEALRAQFQQRFWSERLGLYALALDGAKQRCEVASSNAGHALWAGIAAPEHAARIAARLLEPDLFSGWGVRTLGSGEVRYNPMSYHNGSIWPHDNALVCEGLARYGEADAALALLGAAFDSSLHFDQARLPELFCGFPRRRGEGPTRYPVACSPQAWAAGAAFGMLAGCLGLEFDASQCRVRLRSPRLPAFIDWLRIERLEVAGGRVDMILQRYRDSVGVDITRREGRIEVSVVV
ncbi:glycogen debranching N-terminal domain-containing protein [Caldimonas sp. KR1-144]|uniref:amylo-alpha-1,6-glucosidase n=1 Tax=Caldimonas sp. KR1-144 TaxID=3400911 RepID=UPI003C11BB85